MNILLRYLHWLKRETIKIIPAFIYFAIAFNLIFFTNTLIPNPSHVRYFNYWSITIGAVIAAKALIIANVLPFLNIFWNKPLIFNIIWKLLIYTTVLFILWVIETTIHLEEAYRNIDTVIAHLKMDFHSPTFFSALIWLIVTFFIFIVACEFIAAIGKRKVFTWLFRKAPERIDKG